MPMSILSAKKVIEEEAMRWFLLERFPSPVLVLLLALPLPTLGEGGTLLEESHQKVRMCTGSRD